MTIDQALAIARNHQQAGQWAEAEQIYRRILAQCPNHAEALHMLGVLAIQVGRVDMAIDLIGRAVALGPQSAVYHGNLGEAHRRAGQHMAAIAQLKRAIALEPGLAEAHNNLGTALRAVGRPGEAIAAFQRALALVPGFAMAESNLGNALRDMGRGDEAIAAYQRALTLRPDLAEAHSNLGIALTDAGRRDEALAAFRHALALEPRSAPVLYNVGCVLAAQAKPEEALVAFRQAVALEPGLAGAWNNLGITLRVLGRHGEAITAFERVLALQPGFAEAHNNLGNVLSDQGRADEALAAYQRAVEHRPGYAEAHQNRGNLLRDQGRFDEALACYRTAVAAAPAPGYARAASHLLLTLHYHAAYDAQAILAEHRRWAEQFAAPLAAAILPHENDRAPDRKLKVGFVSPDFRDHPVGRYLVLLFAHHDRGQTEFVVYSDVRKPDAVTARLKTLADGWHDTGGLTDPQLAQRIRDDRIDILVDLALHTLDNRLLVFARKPAPVQVTMLGMPATTGLATIDYRLTDPYLDPPGTTDADYTERSIRLPHCFWCYPAPDEAPTAGALPAGEEGAVTFGCLNPFPKVSRPALELWVRILEALPGSRLVMMAPEGTCRDAVHALFRHGGIAADRVSFVARSSPRVYFERYRMLDLSLDPFPYNGHTSTLDSLWMGVPVITLAGATAVGRGGVSILSNLGLPELIARTPDDYVVRALALAADRPRLASLRASLRPWMQSSPLNDDRQYAAGVETALRGMWTAWCHG